MRAKPEGGFRNPQIRCGGKRIVFSILLLLAVFGVQTGSAAQARTTRVASGAELSLPRAYSWYRFVIKRLDEGVAWEGDGSTADVAAVDTEATYLYEIVR